MEIFSPLLTLCAGNSPVTGDFPAQRPLTRSFGVFFDLRLNKQLSKQSWGWWFQMPSRSFWRHCNVSVQFNFMNGNLYCWGSLHMHFLLTIYSLLSHIYVWTKVTHLKRSTACILYLGDVKCLYVILCPVSGWGTITSVQMSLADGTTVQYIPRNMHTVFLCFALLWLCNRS